MEFLRVYQPLDRWAPPLSVNKGLEWITILKKQNNHKFITQIRISLFLTVFFLFKIVMLNFTPGFCPRPSFPYSGSQAERRNAQKPGHGLAELGLLQSLFAQAGSVLSLGTACPVGYEPKLA